MNKKQKIVAFTVTGVLALILLFPPFVLYLDEEFNVGYGFILNPSEANARVDVSILFIEYLFIITIGGILYFVFKDKQ